MFKIYSSSAGSGKTYTLTKEYLKLALKPGQDDAYFRHILAITFTNAAANEMKERILTELRRFADGESTPLLADLINDLHGFKPTDDGFEPARAEVCQKARAVFKTILHSYSDFSVTTIDSFMQRLVTAFTDELGLPYSFEVEMETDEVLELATDQLLEKAGMDEMEEITEILTQYFEETAAEGHSWNMLPDELRKFGKNLVSDQYYEAINRVADLSPADIRTIRQQMRDFVKDAENQIVGVGSAAWQLITSGNLSTGDFKGGKNGIGAYFELVAGGAWNKKVTDTHLAAIEQDEWYTKTAKLPIQGAINGIADQLRAGFETIQAIRQQVNLLNGLIPHLQKLALLKQIRVEFDALLRKDGRVHISEFNKKIQAIVAAEPVPFIYERLGNKYFHILIDEFQDTSKLQFANLLPLIENSLGFQHFNLAVGDGKQAIYRFRGGDMDQIVSLHRQDLGSLRTAHGTGWTADRIDSLDGHLTSEVLGVNWRSARPIVEFNNQFFEFVARAFDQQHGRIADVFDVLKQFHQQPSPNARAKAHIQIDFVQKSAGGHDAGAGGESDGDEKDLTALMLEKTLAHIEKASADGYRYGDMAILCRKKADAKALANALNAQGIPLVSADSLSLQFSDPVKWLVALMSLLNRPDQKLLRY
ncbi:MAG: UvrD-helicase domain-containing protein, partial [Bacteroidetes bacterium]|nr:UvrD-helicase domain-containing protein [Fibrella sp.]